MRSLCQWSKTGVGSPPGHAPNFLFIHLSSPGQGRSMSFCTVSPMSITMPGARSVSNKYIFVAWMNGFEVSSFLIEEIRCSDVQPGDKAPGGLQSWREAWGKWHALLLQLQGLGAAGTFGIWVGEVRCLCGWGWLRVGNEQDEINTSEKKSSCNTLTEQSLMVFGGLGTSLPFIHILNYFILKLKATTPGGCRCPQSDKALHYENYFQNDPWRILFCPPVSCMKTLWLFWYNQLGHLMSLWDAPWEVPYEVSAQAELSRLSWERPFHYPKLNGRNW